MLYDNFKDDNFVSLLNKSKLSKTNTVFWLHSNVTVSILVFSTIIINLNAYVGDPIDCFTNSDVTRFSDNFCWIYGTTSKGDGREEKHEYYQWIALTLLAQAVLAYIPGWLWSYWEKGHIKEVVGDNGVKILDDILAHSRDRCEQISDEIASKVLDNVGTHRKWAAKFIFCEVLNFVITISQFLFTNYFLNGNFKSYGLDMIEYIVDEYKSDTTNPMEKTFPIVTSCVQHPYGTAGQNEVHFACVLPANIWNQKLYLFLYFWWIFLFTIGAVQLIYRLVTIVSRPFRQKLESWPGHSDYWADYSDWIFYKFVLSNSSPILRKDIRAEIKTRISEDAPVVEEKTKKTPLD